jgi:hypothetical protein
VNQSVEKDGRTAAQFKRTKEKEKKEKEKEKRIELFECDV